MNPSLTGYMAAVLESLDTDGRQRVADELESLEMAVASSAALRAALTDPSVNGLARRAVMADLLEHRVSTATSRIAAFSCLVASAPDVPGAIGDAATHARRIVASGLGEEEPASVLSSRARVGGYAAAIFEDQSTEALEGVEDELFRWALALQDSADLRRALTNRDLPAAERAELVDALLEGKVSSITRSLATYAVMGGRPRDLVGTLEWLVDRVAAERGWRVARVRTARSIDDESRGDLERTLRSLVGRPVELEVAEQPSLLGGVLVEVGDLRVDATARGRLDAIREQLRADRRGAGVASFSREGRIR